MLSPSASTSAATGLAAGVRPHVRRTVSADDVHDVDMEERERERERVLRDDQMSNPGSMMRTPAAMEVCEAARTPIWGMSLLSRLLASVGD